MEDICQQNINFDDLFSIEEKSQENIVYNKIDYLDEDEKIPGQTYVLISFLDPEKIKNTKIRGIKVRGVFDKLEDAQKKANKLRKVDPFFDIYVLEVGKWGAWNPDPLDLTKVENIDYMNNDLNDLMKKYKEGVEKSKIDSERRKHDLIYSEKSNSHKNNLETIPEEKNENENENENKNKNISNLNKKDLIKKLSGKLNERKNKIIGNENVSKYETLEKEKENLESLLNLEHDNNNHFEKQNDDDLDTAEQNIKNFKKFLEKHI